MTRDEVNNNLKEVLKQIDKKDKEQFRKDLQAINKKADKLDSIFKNISDWFGLFFSIGIDNKITKIINDIAENIENPKLDSSIKEEIENLISKFLDKGTPETKNLNLSNTNQGKNLWEETKKVRKAL